MTQAAFVKTILKATVAASILIPSLTGSAFAGEGFFEKIGDGPKNRIREIFTPNKVESPAPAPIVVPTPANLYWVTYRVDCIDARTGTNRADNTVTQSSTVSRADAMNIVLILSRQEDLCQANGDTSRVTKPGSGRWM
jgi:hypothetical protein